MIVIRGGRVLTPEGLVGADVLVEGDVVVAVGSAMEGGGHVIDAPGCLVGPGFVDVHTHLREPGQTWKEDVASASAAAAAGGFTAMVAMPNTEPPIDTPGIVVELRERARQVGLVEVAVAGALTLGRAGRELTDLESLYKAGVRLFTDDGDCLSDPVILRAAMARLASLPGARLAQHAEETALSAGGHLHQGAMAERLGIAGSPAAAEETVVARDLALVAETGVAYHCQHVSSRGTVALIQEAKSGGLAVTAEVTPHHLSYHEGAVEDLDPNFKMYPPLRSPADRAALRDALVEGVIDVVATDHAPHTEEEKAVSFLEAPRGVIGLETAAAVVSEIVDDPDLLFGSLSIRPARLAGLERQGRPLAPGSPANVVVFDPDEV
ncbi:MAG TPA: dihydroorotase, partial [Acidimicrobiia bacterium]|nr:dihydroorotase [Acidimicrobiia bacterium]